MAELLRGLAGQNTGLCVVTTREKVDEIKQHYGRTVIDHSLEFLAPAAGAALLHYSGANRAGAIEIEPSDRELQRVSMQLQGHALTLFLVGQYLKLTQDGDIRRRDDITLVEADAEYSNDDSRAYGHAFKAIEAYERWLASGDVHAQRQLAILRLLSLFDRPAARNWLECVCAQPPIAGLTDKLAIATNSEWNAALRRLEEINLVGIGENGDVDCHPLIREYFARQLSRAQPGAWREAHYRLYKMFLADATPMPTTLVELGPYYRAVAHGCQAGRHNEVLIDVYKAKIQQGQVGFAQKILGAAGEDLAALSWFVAERWTTVLPTINREWQAWLPGNAGSRLRALGRIEDALEPTLASYKRAVEANLTRLAAIRARQLSELLLILGRIDDAIRRGREAVVRHEETSRWNDQQLTDGLGLLDEPLELLTFVKCRICQFDAGEIRQLDDTATIANLSITKVRESGKLDFLPLAVLVRAAVFERQQTAALTDDSVARDRDLIREQLADARLMAERGPMPLMLADILLQQARLFGDFQAGIRARDLIRIHQYGRRYVEI